MRFNYDVKVLDGGWKPLTREGSREQWENKWSVTTAASAAEILESVNNTIANNKTYGEKSESVKWTRAEAGDKSATQSSWRFTDEKAMGWNGVVRVEPKSGERNQFILSVKAARNDSNAKSAGN